VARIDIGTDTNGEDKNEIRAAVTPDHRDYAQIMGTAPTMASQTQHPAPAPAPQHHAPAAAGPAQGYPAPQPQPTSTQQAPAAPGVPGRPSWAQ